MPNNTQNLSRYQTAGIIKFPLQVNPATAYQYCQGSDCPGVPSNAPFIQNKQEDLPLYQQNVSNSLGNGIGTESFQRGRKESLTLQDKPLYKSAPIPYITSIDAPPVAIDVSHVVNHHDNYTFQNKQLAGKASNRSTIPPIIAPPIVSEEYWKTNDFMVPSNINSASTVDLTRSGYLTRPDEEYSTKRREPFVSINSDDLDGMQQPNIQHGSLIGDISSNSNEERFHRNDSQPIEKIREHHLPGLVEHFEQKKPTVDRDLYEPSVYSYSSNVQPIQRKGQVIVGAESCVGTDRTNYDIRNRENCVKKLVTVGPIEEEMINMPYGYNADQLEMSNLPSNLAVGSVARDPVFNKYNEDIFTTIIQPGVYSRTEIVEPLNSNIGVSFPQQFEPVVTEHTKNGVTFVHKDSRIKPINQEVDVTVDCPNEANVYDPRFTGYGTNYRSYVDDMTGQPRFYYDDVMVHRQNNYVTRNKIDFTDFGPKNNGINQEHTNLDIRKKAQDDFTDNAIEFRTQLQMKLLRKINVDSWQQKVAPLSKGGSRY